MSIRVALVMTRLCTHQHHNLHLTSFACSTYMLGETFDAVLIQWKNAAFKPAGKLCAIKGLVLVWSLFVAE